MNHKINNPRPGKFLRHLALGASLVAGVFPAATGMAQTTNTWVNNAGGSWASPANWLGGINTSTTNTTADFSQLTLPADAVVTLDGARTNGNLIFADQGAAHNWFLNTGSGDPLTLAVSTGSPAVIVNNQTVTFGLNLAGTKGLGKYGAGTLVLAGSAGYSGTTTVNGGALVIPSFTVSAASPLSIATGATVNSLGTLSLNANGSSNPSIGVSGAGTLQLAATANSASSPDIYFAANDVDNTTANWGTRLASPVNLGSVQRYVWGKSNHNGVGQYGTTSADCQFGGTISGAGGLTIIAQDSPTQSPKMEVGFALNASNSFTGPLEIQRGSVYQGAAGAFPAGNALRFNVASGNTAKFFLYGQNTTVSDLSSTGAGSAYVANGNANPSAYGPVTLTVIQNNSATFAGTIADVNGEYGATAGSQATTLGLVKNGPATLTLTGANTYSGPTVINAGALNLSNAVILGPVMVQATGVLAVGAATTGTMTISNTLTLATGGTNVLNISKTGGALSSDLIQGLTTFNGGGTLVIKNVTTDGTALAAGDTFQILSASLYAGTYTSFVLPTLPAGLSWDLSQLTISGQIAVDSGAAMPFFSPGPGSYPTAQTVTINSLAPGAVIHYTTDGTPPTASSPNGAAPVTVTVLAGLPNETLTAYVSLPGGGSSGTASATYILTTATWTNLANGNWSDPGNWSYGFVANSSGIVGNFSSLTLAHDTTVTLDTAATAGTLVFADRGNAHNWTVADGGVGPLNLDNGAGSPLVIVSNTTVTIAPGLNLATALTKSGNGTLNLPASTTYTGTTVVNGGALGIDSLEVSSSLNLTIAAGARVNSYGTLSIDAAGSVNPVIGVSGSGTLVLAGTTNGPASPDIYFAANDVDNTTANWGTRIATPVNLGSVQRYIWGKSNHNGVGQYGLTEADAQFAGAISGSGGLTIVAQDSPNNSPKMEVGFCLNAKNTFTGPVEIQRGSVYLGASGAFPSGNILRFNVAAGNKGKFFLYGQNVSATDLSATNAGGAYIANGNANPSAYGPVTLTVTQNNPATFNGLIADVSAEYGVTAGTKVTTLSLVKNGPATLTLAGANTYSGTTTVSAGKLVLSSAQAGTGAVTVNDGAALGVTIAGYSQLAPASLSLGSASGPTTLEFNGAASVSVAPVTTTTLTVKGTTTLNVLTGTFAAGNVYPLIAFTTIAGTGGFVIGSLPANVAATVVTNNGSIALSITAGNILTWNGSLNGTWDIGGTANWTRNGLAGTTYPDGAPVLFDDTATGTTLVNATATVSPLNILVNNTLKAYTIGGSPIAGGASLTKTGANALILTGADTFTGNIAIAAGSLTIGGAGVLGGGTYAGTVTNNGSLIYNSTVDQTNSGAISGPGTLIQDGPDTLTLAVNEPLTGGITVNAGTLRVTTDNYGGQWTPSLVTVNTNGTLLNDNYHALGYKTSVFLNHGTWVLNYEDYKTSLIMVDGQVNAGPAGDGGELRLGNSAISTITVSNSVAGSVINETVNTYSGTNFINVIRGAAASDLTINGAITSGGGAGGLAINGNGIVTLTANNNTYPGSTLVNGGTLALGSSGSLAGSVFIQNNATLLVAGAGIGSPSIAGSLAFAAGGTNLMRIDKTGGTLKSDVIQGLAGVSYGGTLVVSNLTKDATALANGDTVQLFNGTSGGYTGGFSTYVLPRLPAGLSWDVSQLAVSGSIAVVSTVSTPSFNPPAGNYISAQLVTISSLTPGATIYYTTDGSAPTASSPHGVTPVTVTVLATSPTATLNAYGALAGHASSAIATAAYNLSASIWTNRAGGNWSEAGNWLFNTLANSGGITADFSTLTLPRDTTVTNDISPTVGGLVFADRGIAHNWVVADPGGSVITLDNGGPSPIITVSNQTATVAPALDGTAGFTKAGQGALVLGGVNTYTGPTLATAGTLGFLEVVNTSMDSPLTISTGAVVTSSATFNLNVNQNGGSPSVNVSGAGLLRLTSTTNSASSPDLYFGPDHVSNSYWGAHEASPLDLGGLQRFVYCKTGHNGAGEYTLNDTDVMFDGSISGSGGLTFIAQNNWTGSSPMEVGIALNASNTFTGPLEIQRGSVYLGNPHALAQTNVLLMNAASGNNARFFLYGNSIAVANLSSSTAGANVIANGNKLTGATLTLAAATLTVVQNTPGTYAGTIQDVQSEYDGSGSGTTGPLGLNKTGASTLTLAGVNTYGGATVVSGGTLAVSGTLGSGAVTVSAGGTLSGTGTIGGATAVQTGGTLAPGNNGVGTLTIANTLTLAPGSSTTLAINRTSGTGTYGSVAGLTSATFGGMLTVTSLGGTFQAGDSFQLFNVGGPGNFSAFNLPNISPLAWEWNPSTGVLSVGSAVNLTPPQLATTVGGGYLSLAWPADHLGWRLEVQTNNLAKGVSTNAADWATVAGSTSTNQVSIQMGTTKPAEFYRLVYP